MRTSYSILVALTLTAPQNLDYDATLSHRSAVNTIEAAEGAEGTKPETFRLVELCFEAERRARQACRASCSSQGRTPEYEAGLCGLRSECTCR